MLYIIAFGHVRVVLPHCQLTTYLCVIIDQKIGKYKWLLIHTRTWHFGAVQCSVLTYYAGLANIWDQNRQG